MWSSISIVADFICRFNSLPPVGQPQSVPITVRPAAVFPLDVYFLMDFSQSMNDDLATLQSITRDIGEMCIFVSG